MKSINYLKLVKWFSIFTIAFFIVSGIVVTFFELKPFWLDEWFVIYNLKFKTTDELWGKLDFLQQFPRVYMQLVKKISSSFNYSHISLRVPSLIVHTAGVLFLYNLSGRVLKTDMLNRFLWVMVYISFTTSLHYFIQVKQYTMEMALGVTGIWQMVTLYEMKSLKISNAKYLLLCITFLFVPFFSYTYPIVFAPICLILLLQTIVEKKIRFKQSLPVVLGIVSIIVFYMIDVKQVMGDKDMYNYWDELLLNNEFSIASYFLNLYAMFTNMGAGELFENVFGILGISSWLYLTYKCIKHIRRPASVHDILKLYCVSLLWLIFCLYTAGKLPVGTHRFNAFATPFISLSIIYMLIDLKEKGRKLKNISVGVSTILYLATTGNIISTVITNDLVNKDYQLKNKISQNTGEAIELAQLKNLPILATPSIAYPHQEQIKGDWVLKTHPKYDVSKSIPVYPVPDTTTTIPSELRPINKAVLVRAESYEIVSILE